MDAVLLLHCELLNSAKKSPNCGAMQYVATPYLGRFWDVSQTSIRFQRNSSSPPQPDDDDDDDGDSGGK